LAVCISVSATTGEYHDDVIQVQEKSGDVDSTDGDLDEFTGRSTSSTAAAAGVDRWTGFEYTPVHLSYR